MIPQSKFRFIYFVYEIICVKLLFKIKIMYIYKEFASFQEHDAAPERNEGHILDERGYSVKPVRYRTGLIETESNFIKITYQCVLLLL